MKAFAARIEARHGEARVVLTHCRALYEHLRLDGKMPESAPTATTLRALGAALPRIFPPAP